MLPTCWHLQSKCEWVFNFCSTHPEVKVQNLFILTFSWLFICITYIDLSTIGGHITAALFCAIMPVSIFVEYKHRQHRLDGVIFACQPCQAGPFLLLGSP
jgi:hypothetical protein